MAKKENMLRSASKSEKNFIKKADKISPIKEKKRDIVARGIASSKLQHNPENNRKIQTKKSAVMSRIESNNRHLKTKTNLGKVRK